MLFYRTVIFTSPLSFRITHSQEATQRSYTPPRTRCKNGCLRTVPSRAADQIVSPSGANATCVTGAVCSVNVATHDQPFVLHNRTVLSSDADATSLDLEMARVKHRGGKDEGEA